MSLLTATLLSLGMTSALSSATPYDKIASAVSLTPKPMQYGKVEWAVVVNAQLKDPYNQAEVKLDLRLRQPNHQEILVPAYYERGKNTVE